MPMRSEREIRTLLEMAKDHARQGLVAMDPAEAGRYDVIVYLLRWVLGEE